MPIAELILGLIQAAPGAISEITNLYHAVKMELSSSDQATIDAALVAAQDDDATATARADAALASAANRT